MTSECLDFSVSLFVGPAHNFFKLKAVAEALHIPLSQVDRDMLFPVSQVAH